MNSKQFAVFVALLILPTLWQRLNFRFNFNSFYVHRLRTWSKLQIHHGHWGLLWMFVSLFALAFGKHNMLTIGLAGLGMGLVLDEIIPALKMPTVGRTKELEVYAASLRPTICVIAAAILVALALFFTCRP